MLLLHVPRVKQGRMFGVAVPRCHLAGIPTVLVQMGVWLKRLSTNLVGAQYQG